MTSALKKQEVQEEDWAGLMEEYKRNGDIASRNRLVMHYSYIARTVSGQMRGIFSNYAQMEDIVNQGIITLIDCVERFDPGKGLKFESYAYMRVRGGVIDFVRKQDWLPRRVHMAAKSIATARDQLCNELLREPTQQELAARMNVSPEALAKSSGEIANAVLFSFEELLQNVAQSGGIAEPSAYEDALPESRIFQEELHHTLEQAIDSLSERERLVISLYYYENLRLSDIAAVMQVTEQRVSQINSRAVSKLREPLGKYMKG